MKSKSVLIPFILVLMSSFFALLIAEGLVRLILPQNKMVTWLQMHPDGFMMNQQGGEAFQEFDERLASYSFNDQRLRTSTNQTKDSTILMLGDSFTFGLLLNESSTFIHHLNESTPNTNLGNYTFLNGGIGGSGLSDLPAWLDEFGANVQPNRVLYVMNIHDIERSLSKNIYVLKDGELVKSQRWEPRPFFQEIGKQTWYRWLQSKSHLFNIIVKLLWKNAYFDDVTYSFDPDKTEVLIPKQEDFLPESDYPIQLGLKLLEKLKNWCNQNNCEFAVTTTGYFPVATDVSAHTVSFRDYLASPANNTGIPFFDISPCVSDKVNGDYDMITIPGDSHPNEKGAKIIAECMRLNLAF